MQVAEESVAVAESAHKVDMKSVCVVCTVSGSQEVRLTFRLILSIARVYRR